MKEITLETAMNLLKDNIEDVFYRGDNLICDTGSSMLVIAKDDVYPESIRLEYLLEGKWYI